MTRAAEIPAVNGTESEVGRRAFWPLTLGCMGVVYGDIGTSPLYAFRVALEAAGGHQGDLSRGTVLGVLSLILWALILVVTAKYVLILLRADNKGEGGTLSLMALAQRALGSARSQFVVLLLGMIAAALFYGDALLTPAISVLSAVEGLEVAAPQLKSYVVPLTVLILVLLFSVQSHGTARVAAFFGPVMTLWFLALGLAGLTHIADDPGVLAAFNPAYADRVSRHPWDDRAGHAWRRIPRGDRCRGPLRRSRPFRAQADPDGLALFRAAGARSQLSRSRRAGALRPDGDRQTPSTASCRHGRSIR